MYQLICVMFIFFTLGMADRFYTITEPNSIKCKINEVLDQCPNYCNYEDNCDTIIRELNENCSTPSEYKCIPKCVCEKGFVRIGNECEPIEKCCDKQTEEIVDCPSTCEYTCEGRPDNEVGCKHSPCLKKGCRCKRGFVRHYEGYCTLKEDCLSCNKSNEVYDFCGTACEATCGKKVQFCTKKCVEGCFCMSGFVRDENGNCVDPKECIKNKISRKINYKSRCSKENEEYSECGSCDPTCDDLNSICAAVCREGCFCKNGFVRGDDGNCIDPEKCPSKCYGKNEEYSECGTCDPTCDNLNPKCSSKCRKECFCKSGFVRDSGWNCIDQQECPLKCNGENEEFSECGSCDSSCENPNPTCSGCRRDCFCKSGYVRDLKWKCIERSMCPESNWCTEQNEVYSDCPNACTSETNCNTTCIPDCVCREGFVRKDGVCVEEDPKRETCDDPNEEYSECTNPCSPGATCEDPCTQGCVCKDGYIRENEVCVEEKSVQEECTDTNEEYSECTNACPQNATCVAPCMPGCVCKKGYIRENGKCKEDTSSKCSKPNEEYSFCVAECPQGSICTFFCKSGCTCKKGFVRKNDICVKETTNWCKGPNEEYASCANFCPPGIFCAAVCIPRCTCIPGHVRENGICKKINEESTTTDSTLK